MLGVLIAATAGAADPTAEAERLQEELRALARQGRWDGVELVWRQLGAIGVDPSPEACQEAADGAIQLGHLAEALERLACAPDTEDNRARTASLRGTTARVALFAKGDGAFEPEQMPFQPDAARAVRNAAQALDRDGFYGGLLPVGRYRLGQATIALQSQSLLVARSTGEQAQGAANAAPHLGAMGGRWLDVPLSARQVGDVVRSDPSTAGGWQAGTALQRVGVGAFAVGVCALLVSPWVPPPPPPDPLDLHPPHPLDPGPLLTVTGAVLGGAGAGSWGVGYALRSSAAHRFTGDP